MTTKLLIYNQARPVSPQRYKDWSVKTGTDYSFAQYLNSMPLMSVEFPAASTEYPIVFTGTEQEIIPAIILGVKSQENLYVTNTGKWEAKYIPAFVRRYPFVFSSSDNGETFTLCIDEEFEGCNQEGRGERLFDSEGEQTQYLGNILEFLKEYQIQFQRTQTFCKKLKDLNLLEPMQAQFKLGAGEQLSLTGFMGVSREQLKKLSGEQLANLMQTDELDLIYLHLHSMAHFSTLAEKVSSSEAPKNPENEEDSSVVQETPELAGSTI
ncbi:SapC family protein [Anabaena azotica]|uniref:SapC family protein n=1 Tax=Anabaena azotica TaxID=197653 RepID=UPI0039A5E3E5